MTLVDTIRGDMVELLAATSRLHLFLHLKHPHQHLVCSSTNSSRWECQGKHWAGIKINFRSFFEATRNLMLNNIVVDQKIISWSIWTSLRSNRQFWVSLHIHRFFPICSIGLLSLEITPYFGLIGSPVGKRQSLLCLGSLLRTGTGQEEGPGPAYLRR